MRGLGSGSRVNDFNLSGLGAQVQGCITANVWFEDWKILRFRFLGFGFQGMRP